MTCNSETFDRTITSVTWNRGNILKELVNLANEISSQNADCVNWLLIADVKTEMR